MNVSTSSGFLTLFSVLSLAIFCASCGARPDQVADSAEAVASDTSSVPIPSLTKTRILFPTPSPTATSVPPATPTQTATLRPTPTPNTELRGTRAGAALPGNLAVISVENVADIQPLARWGKGSVETVVHSPDGKLIAVASSRGAYLYDAFQLSVVGFIPTERWTHDVALSPDGSLLALQTACTTEVHRVEDGSLLWSRELPDCFPEGSVAFSPDGTLVAAGLDDIVQIRRASSGQIMHDLETSSRLVGKDLHQEPSSVLDMHFSPDGWILAVSQNEPGIDLFDASSGSSLVHWSETGVGADLSDKMDSQSIAFSPNGSHLISLDEREGRLAFFDLTTMELDYSLAKGEIEGVASLALAPLGDLFAVGESSGFIRDGPTDIQIRNTVDGKLMHELQGHAGSITSLSFSPDGERLVSGAMDNTIRLWRVSDGVLLGVVHDHTDQIFDIDFSPDGSILAAAMWDRNARLWSIPNGALLHKLGAESKFGYWYEGFIPGMFGLDFSPDGQVLATGSDWHAGVWLWDVASGAPLTKLYSWGHIFNVKYSPDGEALAIVAGELGRWSRWELELLRISDEAGVATQDPPALYQGLAISPLSRFVAASFYEWEAETMTCIIDLWDLSSSFLQNRRSLLQDDLCPTAMVFSPDEDRLALAFDAANLGGELPRIDLIRVGDGSLEQRIPLSAATDGEPIAIAFSPDGEILVAAFEKSVVRFWRTQDGTPLTDREHSTPDRLWTFSYPDLRNDLLAFSPDGKLFAMVLSDGSVVLWGVVP